MSRSRSRSRSTRKSLVLTLGAVGCLAACTSQQRLATCEHGYSRVAHGHSDAALVDHMYTALLSSVEALVASLPSGQAERLVAPYDASMRTRGFCYVLAHCKDDHTGLRLRSLDATQRRLVHQVLVRALSSAGYYKAVAIVNREAMLQEMEDAHRAAPEDVTVTGSPRLPQWTPPAVRDPYAYYIALYGDAKPEGTWGLRFEGHHLSINLSFSRDDRGLHVGVAPAFLGTSPMVVPAAPTQATQNGRWQLQQGQHVLGHEVNLARDIVRALTETLTADARGRGDWGSIPPAELAGGTDMPLDVQAHRPEAPGVAVAELPQAVRALAWTFVHEYVANYPLSVIDWGALEGGMRGARIWWSGNSAADDGHFYFRMQSQRYLFELLQAPNYSVDSEVEANHVHSSFRDLQNDFDYNALGEHVRRHHRPAIDGH